MRPVTFFTALAALSDVKDFITRPTYSPVCLPCLLAFRSFPALNEDEDEEKIGSSGLNLSTKPCNEV